MQYKASSIAVQRRVEEHAPVSEAEDMDVHDDSESSEEEEEPQPVQTKKVGQGMQQTILLFQYAHPRAVSTEPWTEAGACTGTHAL